MGKRKLFIGIDKGYKWQVFDERYRDIEREYLPGCPDELMRVFASLSIEGHKIVEAFGLYRKDL